MFLVELQNHVFSLIKAGAFCNDIYNKAVAYIEEKRADLVPYFVKNCGFGMGIEFRESNFLLSAKNTRALQNNMILNVTLGFQNLENQSNDSKNKVYSLFLGDTVQVTQSDPIILTEADKQLSVISYTFGDEDEEDDATKITELPRKRGAILESQLRSNEDRAENEAKRKAHQKSLHEKRLKDGLARFSETQDSGVEKQKLAFKKFESYRKDAPLPPNVSELKVVSFN